MNETQILQFIKRFQHPYTLVLFTRGCCYWFATILFERFYDYGAEIMYAPIENHFAVRINKEIYDITGNITESSIYTQWVRWCDFDDELERKRIERDCILFLPYD